MKAELLDKIGAQQGKDHSPVWHVGEHLKEFLEAHPQYETLISEDLDTPEMALPHFEAKIREAARKNGGGMGGKAADDVLRKFFGLPDTDTPQADKPKTPDLPFDFTGGLW